MSGAGSLPRPGRWAPCTRLADHFDADHGLHDLPRKSARSAVLTVVSQGARFLLQITSTMILARLLAPAEYGLVAMVTSITGAVVMFKDAGLSMATVQRERITHEQISTLFWVNVGISALLVMLLVATAPLIGRFYNEPRLIPITLALSSGLIFAGLSVQHGALLHRQMRFGARAAIDIVAQTASIIVAIVMARRGHGYWSLVGMTLTVPIISMLGTWLCVRWLPGSPRRGTGIRSMLRFGGNMTAENLLNYFARNADNILIGWAWGTGALGLYGKAYQILLLPISQIANPIASVAIPTLARLQNEPLRFRRYFLSGYRGLISIIVPVIAIFYVYADRVVFIVLGDQWSGATILFLFLAPAALAGALMNPLGWILTALGRADRHLRISLVVSPLIVLSFVAGLPWGAHGVALAYSACMSLLLFPIIHAMTKGTGICLLDVIGTMKCPLLAAIPAGLAGWAFKVFVGRALHPALDMIVGGFVTLTIYALVLIVLMRQGRLYLEIWRQLRPARIYRPMATAGA